MAAARYTQDYDGYLAGAPGYNLPLAALANIYGAQRYATVATGNPATPPGLETAFTAAERRVLADAVLARCDGSTARPTAWCRTPAPASASSTCSATCPPAPALATAAA